jgi:hypothetical protein
VTDYSELIEPSSADEIEEAGLALAQTNNLPITSWGEGGTWRTLLEIVSDALASVWFNVAQIARGGVLEFSSGSWLDRLLQSQYGEDRVSEITTYGKILYTDHGAGPHTIATGAFVATVGGLKFVTLAGGTLPLNGSLSLDVRAVGPGAKYNVPSGTISQLVTSYPSVTVDNPAIGTTGTWITVQGADAESDAAAKIRAAAKWATLSTGSPPSAYLFWALSQAGVTRAAVDDGNPDGPNTVRVYIDNAGMVATLQAFLATKIPSGTRTTASAATPQAVTIPGVVTVRRDQRTAAQAAVEANLTTLQGVIDIGGVVREAEITEQIMLPPGVVDFVMGSGWAGAPNIQLGPSSIVVFTVALTYVEV